MTHAPSRTTRLLREMRVSFVLALPLALGQLAAMLMSVVDSLLAGRHGLRTLAAVTVGSSIWTVALLLCVGVLMAIPPSVAQAFHAQIAGSRLVVFDDLGHVPQEEDPARTVLPVQDFLAGLPQPVGR